MLSHWEVVRTVNWTLYSAEKLSRIAQISVVNSKVIDLELSLSSRFCCYLQCKSYQLKAIVLGQSISMELSISISIDLTTNSSLATPQSRSKSLHDK